MNKIKALGLALVAMLAVSAVAASGAAAQGEEFHSEASSTTLNAEALTTQLFTVTGGDLGTECQEVNVDATVSGETVSTITASPEYSECTEAGGSRVIHVDFTSCAYVFHAELSGSQAPVDITCEGTDEVDITVTTIFGELNCLKVPEQTPEGGVTYANTGEHIDISAEVEGIEYTEQGPCGESTLSNGTYTGDVTVGGEDEGENQVDIFWE